MFHSKYVGVFNINAFYVGLWSKNSNKLSSIIHLTLDFCGVILCSSHMHMQLERKAAYERTRKLRSAFKRNYIWRVSPTDT